MSLTDNDEMEMRRYLLGEVTDQGREQVEQQLMTDSQYLGHFLRTEESLLDEYVNGKLDEDERGPFETYFLSAPERRDKLEFARSLNRYITEAKARKLAEAAAADSEATGSRESIFWLRQIPGRAVTALLVIAMLALTASTIILLTDNARLRERVLEGQTGSNRADEELQKRLGEQTERNEGLARHLEQSRNEVAKIEQELARIKQEQGRRTPNPSPKIARGGGDRRPLPDRGTAIPDPPSKIFRGGIDNLTLLTPGAVSLIIAPGPVRDKGQANRVYLTNDTQQLRLELKVEGETYESCRVEAQTVGGKIIWREGDLRAQQRAGENIVVTTLPAAQLTEGDYLITLSAAAPGESYEEVATYYFTILRK